MKKRFIAIISLVVVLVAVILTIVIVDNKKEIYVDKDGIEHWIYKNNSDMTILNENGDIVIYATDLNGKRQKDENGEYITGAIDFPEQIINGNTLETPDYRITMPRDWKLSADGEITLKKNEDVRLTINKIGDIGDKSLNEFFEERVNVYKEHYEKYVENKNPNFSTGLATITAKRIECHTFEFKQMSEDGNNIDRFVLELFFVNDGEVFQITYVCENGSYDENIDIIGLLHTNLTTK